MLDVLRAAHAALGEAPSVRAMARRMGVHLTTMQGHLQALHRKGHLRTPTPDGLPA